MERRILVLADTHRNIPLARQCLRDAGMVDEVIHLGDCIQDAMELREEAGLPFQMVAGNNDWDPGLPREITFHLGGLCFLAIHGDQYELNQYAEVSQWQKGLDNLIEAARRIGADAVLFGHTHAPMNETREGILLFNPGHMCLGARTGSYGILEVFPGSVRAMIFHVENPSLFRRKG